MSPEPPDTPPAKLTLSREQRARLFDNECPRISGEGQCPLKAGDIHALSSKVTLKVLGILRSKKGGWILRYEIHDRRDPVRLLRRTPAIHDEDFNAIRAGFDEYGYPAEPTKDVIDAAATESAYTSAPSPLSDAGEAVDALSQKRISKGELATDAQQRYDRQRSQEAAARSARPPEEQVRDELEALRREAPKDARRYEVQLVQLADRIKAKRRRRAA